MSEAPPDSWHDEVLVVIPSVNGESLLARMLPTLGFAPANTVVLDQGSTDRTEELCRAAGVAFVQLGRPHTYTEACNIGARMAKERGCLYLCVCNNDITFRTDVIAAMRAEMRRDPALGMVAPSQVIVDEAAGERSFTSRVYWDLDRIDFLHDVASVARTVLRLESDFCELTCAMVRMAAIAAIGFLDDAFGFYHEDADFGFRLRQAGWSTAYLPQEQIDHFSSSTFGREMSTRKKEFIAKNRRHFTAKHLGYGVRPSLPTSTLGGPWDAFGCDLTGTLLRAGLVEVTAPELVMAPPGVDTQGYCYTDHQAQALPSRWARHAGRYRAVFTPAPAMLDTFAAAGFQPCFHVPAGVETDMFHPWGPLRRPFDAPTFLVLADGWQASWLQEVLDAWRGFVASGQPGWMILSGQGLARALGRAPDHATQSGTTSVARLGAERMEVHDQLAPIAAAELAQFYRAMDFVVPNPADSTQRVPLLRAAACGLPALAGPGAMLADIMPPDGLRFASGGLLDAMQAAVRLSTAERDALSAAAMYHVRSHGTLRHTVAGLYAALSQLQVRDPAESLRRIGRRDTTEALAAAGSVSPARSAAARKVMAAGRLTERFGSTWEEKGLRAAGRTVASELRFFLSARAAAPASAPPSAAPVAPPPPARPATAARPEPPLADSTLLVGYIDAQLGLGQSLRGLARAMAATPCRFAICPVGLGVEGRRGEPYMPERYDTVGAHQVNVLEVATNELPNVRAHLGEYHFDRSYNILRTYWELSRAPELWRPNLVGIDEMWAPTRFVADSFRPIFDGPITVVPPCIDLPQPAADGAAQFGLDPARFHFLFSFDYYSFPQRKNPLGVVRAFRRAFPDPRTPVGLIVKSTGAAGHFPDVKQALRQAANRDGRIVVIDESLTRDEMLALMAASGCYVSLHRSEGFGLGMAEAMALGKPVIGTDYSGSTDFLTPETGFPVACTLRPVRPDEYVHTEDQVWAEPDETACAAAMASAVADPPGTASRAEAGRRFIAEHFGPPAVGALVQHRLAAIAARPRGLAA